MLRTFETSEETYQKFKAISVRENKPVGKLLNELIEEYIKNHGEGNPIYPLTKWYENPEFFNMPTLKTDFEKWNNYLSTCTEDQLKDIKDYADHVASKSEQLLKK